MSVPEISNWLVYVLTRDGEPLVIDDRIQAFSNTALAKEFRAGQKGRLGLLPVFRSDLQALAASRNQGVDLNPGPGNRDLCGC